MALHKQIIKSDLNWHGSEVHYPWVFFLQGIQNVSQFFDLYVMFNLLVPIDDDDLAVFTLLVLFSVFFEFVLSVMLA
jgi:hypothetical protein